MVTKTGRQNPPPLLPLLPKMSQENVQNFPALHCICFSKALIHPVVQRLPPPPYPLYPTMRILPPFFILYSQSLNRFIVIESIITVTTGTGEQCKVLNFTHVVKMVSHEEERDLSQKIFAIVKSADGDKYSTHLNVQLIPSTEIHGCVIIWT